MGAKHAVNPFRFGPLALDEAFTDRRAEIDSLVADARNGQDVVVLAPRRYGKSSLVWRVAQELVKEDVLVAQVDLMRTPTKDQLAAKLAKTIHEELATRLWNAKERLKVFAGLRLTPIITVDPNDGTVSFSFDARAAKEDIDATLEELLTMLGRIAADRGRRVVLVLDEFQEVVDIDPALIRLMRSVFQEQPEVAHIYLGSKRHMMRQIFNDENEPFWRSAKQTELDVIPPDLFAPYALAKFDETGKQLSPDACARALELTGGHPYATQELLYFLWEETPAGEAADIATIDGALDATLRSEHSHFSLIWDGVSAAQKRVLQALAQQQPGRPLSTDYQRRHSLPATPTVQTAVNALERGELVRRLGRGEYRIAEPFLTEWIQRYES
ncbi:MAG: AAA family ATPase [Thermoleophilaceae bacterium]